MEDSHMVKQSYLDKDKDIKSEITLSIGSDTMHHMSTSCSSHHHENFKSSTSCSNSINSSHTSNTSNTATLNSVTMKSNSPAVFIRTNRRRNSLSINSGDIVDQNLTVLHLSNSETMDTNDVYVMATELSPTALPPPPHKHSNTTHKHHPHHQSLAVPKWTTEDLAMDSMDEYDSDAHCTTDEDIIIKRVLAKFNQQNQRIIRRKLSFVDNFKFIHHDTDARHVNSRSFIPSNRTKPKKRYVKKQKKKTRKRHSEFERRKISQGHKELLQEISRRATVPPERTRPPPILTHTIATDKRKQAGNTRNTRTRPTHSRTITPFDPISIGVYDREGSPEIVMEHSDYEEERRKPQHRHTKTLNFQTQTQDIKYHTSVLDSPSTSVSVMTPVLIHHKKTLSHGPLLMSTQPSHHHIRHTASIVPNMKDDEVMSEMFEAEWSESSDHTPQVLQSQVHDATVAEVQPEESGEKETEKEEADDAMDDKWQMVMSALNEASSDEENMEPVDDDEAMEDSKQTDSVIQPTPLSIREAMQSHKPKPKHRRLTSAPVVVGQNDPNGAPLHAYRTWNYDEELSDSLKSDENEEDAGGETQEMEDHPITYGTERVFSTFTKELAITTENPSHLFESLSQICVSLRSTTTPSTKTRKHEIPFDSPLLQHERVISFIKLLGFLPKYDRSVYILHKIDNQCIDYALAACQQQLIEIAKKTATYQVIVSSRLRYGSPIPPPPPPIEENKSDKPTHDELEIESVDIDADRCQLYELIWSATHENNTDHKAKEVILLCFILITSPLKFLKLLEARFFNDDHGRASYSTSTDSNLSNNPSPSTLGSMGQSPSIPSLPPLTPTFAGNPSNVSITFDYERIQSSYGVQRKVVHMMKIWMEQYWKEDWDSNAELVEYMDAFVEKANKAYQNDLDFDDNERHKGLELVSTIQKTMQKKRAEMKYNTADFNLFDVNSSAPQMASVAPQSRKRSATDSKYVKTKRKPLKVSKHTRPRRKSLHKRKFSLLSSPRLSLIGSHSDTMGKTIPDDVLKIPNLRITHQIAHYLFKKYSAINARECLYQYCLDKRTKELKGLKSPNVQIYKDTFNGIVKWVQSSILLQSQVAKRARMIKKWIKITDELFNVRCFQGFVAVQCALASNAIYTLKDAWNQNNVLKRKHHTKFKEIKVIMSASHNFENLRRLQREAHAPLIPYFGLFCKDLIYIQEGFAKRNQDGMINWSKLWKIAELIKDYFEYKNTPYNRIVEEDIPMQKWLETELQRSGTLNSDHLDKMSRDVAQQDKNKKSGRHHKSFTTLMQ